MLSVFDVIVGEVSFLAAVTTPLILNFHSPSMLRAVVVFAAITLCCAAPVRMATSGSEWDVGAGVPESGDGSKLVIIETDAAMETRPVHVAQSSDTNPRTRRLRDAGVDREGSGDTSMSTTGGSSGDDGANGAGAVCNTIGGQPITDRMMTRGGIRCVRVSGTDLDPSFTNGSLPGVTDPHVISSSLRSTCAQLGTIWKRFGCNHAGTITVNGVGADGLRRMNVDPATFIEQNDEASLTFSDNTLLEGFVYKVNPVVLDEAEAGVVGVEFDRYEHTVMVQNDKCSCQRAAAQISHISSGILRVEEGWTYPQLGASTFPVAPNSLKSGASYTIAPPTLRRSNRSNLGSGQDGEERPISFSVNNTRVTDGVTFSLSFAAKSLLGGKDYDGDPHGMYVESQTGEVMARPKRAGVYSATLVAQQVHPSSWDSTDARGRLVGARVWTWEFVVLAAAEFMAIAGSATRGKINSALPVGRSGQSIGEGHTCRMAVGGDAFYLGPIETINFTQGTYYDSSQIPSEVEKSDMWHFLIHPLPKGFKVDILTGEVHGVPTEAMERTLIKNFVLDDRGRKAVVESFYLEVNPNRGGDTHPLSLGSAVAVALGSIVAVLAVGLLLIGPWVKRRYFATQQPLMWTIPHQDGTSPNAILRQDLRFIECIGTGAFGEVWKASLRRRTELGIDRDIIVAAKRVKLRDDRPLDPGGSHTPDSRSHSDLKVAEENSKLLDEAMLMAKVGYHQNLVSIVGIIAAEKKEPCILVIAYCEYGSLRSVLKFDFANGNPMSELGSLEIGLDIICGMQHLVEMSVIHRDLAARNVMVASGPSSTGYVAKVADFGLSRMSIGDNAQDEYYRSETGVFALRWTPPEGITLLKFTHASDVWSFGIVMVEIYLNGSRPFPDVATNPEVLALTLSGQRHSQPPTCPTHMYMLLLQCWAEDADVRPTFAALNERFATLIEAKRGPAVDRGGSVKAHRSLVHALTPPCSPLPSDNPYYQYQRPNGSTAETDDQVHSDSSLMSISDPAGVCATKGGPANSGPAGFSATKGVPAANVAAPKPNGSFGVSMLARNQQLDDPDDRTDTFVRRKIGRKKINPDEQSTGLWYLDVPLLVVNV
jgi:serine/threonine protein kinase